MRVYLSHMTASFAVYEYLGVVVAVNLDPDIETIVVWTPIHTEARILGVHDSICQVTSLITATGIMRPTTNI